jgi:hypothetical protein
MALTVRWAGLVVFLAIIRWTFKQPKAFELPDLEGRRHAAQDYAGKVVILCAIVDAEAVLEICRRVLSRK